MVSSRENKISSNLSFVLIYYYYIFCFGWQEYLKSVVPSQLMAERGGNLVLINPGSANIRMGLAPQQAPFTIPHCIARFISVENQGQTLQDQMLNSQVTPAQKIERDKAYNIIASLVKIPFLNEEVANNSIPRKTVRVDGLKPQNSRNDSTFSWTNVMEKNQNTSLEIEKSEKKDVKGESVDQLKGSDGEPNSGAYKFREYICGEEAMRIPPSKPYCLRRPIRRGHLNISQHYSMQQVFDDLYTIWDWILNEKLHIPQAGRNMYSAVLIVPETFDTREIKELLSLILRDLRFSSAVVHQEGLAAVFGNGLSTACVVNMGAQMTSIICVESLWMKSEDGVALPTTGVNLPFGGETILYSLVFTVSPAGLHLEMGDFGVEIATRYLRCLLWSQRHHQTWPPIYTDPLLKPIDLLMLNKLKESYCQIKSEFIEGEVDAVALVHSYEDNMPAGVHKTRLTALNVPPMGVFYPRLLVPDEHPPPARFWFRDYEDMLEDTWHMEFPRRPDMPDGLFLNANGGLSMWDNYPVLPTRLKRAITWALQRQLQAAFSPQIGGVALTGGLVAAVEDRVLHAIPSNEAVDTVEVLPSRTDPTFVSWRGGSILAILDIGREAWIHREDWIRNGIHVASGRKYKDSFFLQAQAMCYMNS
ncbi:hypothetical protein IFM89_023176 [Coptis chinensis]|uniref:Actin-related protein 9 n=1 Tax=Coptis chinensis TaxID=261450 RepID=A0A835HXD8_9MAGN|nr:hypothetical protein IFM89_023176 [Coptis chinensis]